MLGLTRISTPATLLFCVIMVGQIMTDKAIWLTERLSFECESDVNLIPPEIASKLRLADPRKNQRLANFLSWQASKLW